MTTPILKIKVLPKTTIKGKMDVRFPASVEATSPVLIDKIGGSFTFSLDPDALSQFLVNVPPSALAAQPPETVIANNTGATASPSAVTYAAFADNLFGSATVGAVATRFGSQWGATAVGASGQPLIGNGGGVPASFGNMSSVYSVFTNTGTGAAQKTVSSRLLQVKNVFDYGAVGDGVTDDTTAIQNAINAAAAASSLGNRAHGKVFAPPGYVFKVSTGLIIDKPIDVDFRSHIQSASTSGTVININSTDPSGNSGYQDFLLYFAGLTQTSGNVAQPLSVNGSGLTGVRINGAAFCRIQIGVLQGFTNIGLHCDGTGGLGWQQVIQHNTITLGQVIFNGYGIYMNSTNAATSSCQVCRWDIQNIYGCYTCIRMDNSASDSHSFWINAMDNAQQYGIQCSGGWNNFYVGYTAAPIRFETGAKYNTVTVANTLATGASFTDVDGYATSNNRMFSSGADWATQVGSYIRLDQLSIPSADISINGHRLAFLADPANPQDAATKNYSDTHIGGLTTFAVGDLVYATGAAAFAKLADIATGNALISGGVGVAPSWGKVGLTTHVTGTLPVANGGTGDTGTAWTSYTPTVTAGSGSITTVSATGRHKTIGKTCHVELVITITTNGTGATSVNATLPFAAQADSFFGGKERAISGKLVGAAVQATGSTMAIGFYDNTYPGANGAIIVISGVYETT